MTRSGAVSFRCCGSRHTSRSEPLLAGLDVSAEGPMPHLEVAAGLVARGARLVARPVGCGRRVGSTRGSHLRNWYCRRAALRRTPRGWLARGAADCVLRHVAVQRAAGAGQATPHQPRVGAGGQQRGPGRRGGHRRRGRLPTVRARRREFVSSSSSHHATNTPEIPHIEPALQRLGRRVRRPGRRRRDDRPHCPPRRRPDPQGRQLPTPRQK